MERKKILWLCSWYPNRNDPFDGDFVQRHARAAAIYSDIHVIALKPASFDEEVTFNSPGLTEQLFYFRKNGGLFKPLDLLHWFNSYKKLIRNYIKSQGKPALVHVHVPWNAGLLALWIKRRYGVPFVVTEHWGIYNSDVQPPYPKRPFFFRLLVKKIMHETAELASVSTAIAKGIHRYVTPVPFSLVRNVVDTSLFFYKEKKESSFIFLHVSNHAPVKNVEGILEATALLEKHSSICFKLVIVGNRNEDYVKKSRELGLSENIVSFRGEISYAEVASEMQQANCLIMNSVSENAPCVISEALCVGLPVITTMVGGIPELVDNENSIEVIPGDAGSLCAAMRLVLEQPNRFNGEEISRKAALIYGMKHVGKQLDKLYSEIFTRNGS